MQPVLNGWRPVTRKPPGTTTAFAVAPGVFETTLRAFHREGRLPDAIRQSGFTG